MSIARDSLLRIYWVTSLCALAFAGGIAVGVYKFFPYELLQQIAFTARELIRYPRHTLGLDPEKFLAVSPPPGGGASLAGTRWVGRGSAGMDSGAMPRLTRTGSTCCSRNT